MARIIVNFDSEQDAQELVDRLSRADIGDVRSRVLKNSERISYNKDQDTAPMISPGMGSVEVRPAEDPDLPEAIEPRTDDEISASIPATGTPNMGVQVLIEVDDEHEEAVRKILRDT